MNMNEVIEWVCALSLYLPIAKFIGHYERVSWTLALIPVIASCSLFVLVR